MVTLQAPCGETHFEGRSPGALSARNRADQGPEGENRREGSQTLRTERSVGRHPAQQVDLGVWHVLKGTGSP